MCRGLLVLLVCGNGITITTCRQTYTGTFYVPTCLALLIGLSSSLLSTILLDPYGEYPYPLCAIFQRAIFMLLGLDASADHELHWLEYSTRLRLVILKIASLERRQKREC